MPIPQSVAVFGFEGLARKHPDFVTAYVMNHILGGGGFASKLMEEVREKRGLAYSVYSYLQPYDNAAILAGSVATKNEKLAESLNVIREQIKRMAEEGISALPVVNPPMAPPKAFPSVPVIISTWPLISNSSVTPRPVSPTTPAEWHSSTMTSASYLAASSTILSMGATLPSIENTPSVTMIL